MFFFLSVPTLDKRAQERKALTKSGVLQGINMSVALIVPTISTVATFSVHVAMGENLTSAQVRLHNRQLSLFEFRVWGPYVLQLMRGTRISLVFLFLMIYTEHRTHENFKDKVLQLMSKTRNFFLVWPSLPYDLQNTGLSKRVK